MELESLLCASLSFKHYTFYLLRDSGKVIPMVMKGDLKTYYLICQSFRLRLLRTRPYIETNKWIKKKVTGVVNGDM